MNTISSGTNTISKRSASRQQQRLACNDSFVKDYNKKRWLILALLSVEIEQLVVNDNPMETKESLVNLLSKRGNSSSPSAGNVIGKLFEDAMKFLDEVRLRYPEKLWKEAARNAWEVSPSLAVFLPQRLNNAQVYTQYAHQ